MKIATEAQNDEMNETEQKSTEDKSSKTVEESATKKADDSDEQDNDNPQTQTAKTGQECSVIMVTSTSTAVVPEIKSMGQRIAG